MEAPAVRGSRLGVVVGHSLPDGALAAGAEVLDVDTPWGPVGLLRRGDLVVLPRHGRDTFTLAHAIDHHRNIAGLCAAGCDRVLALGSVGSLRAELPVGTIVAPDDLFAPSVNPTFFDDRRAHRVPAIDGRWRSTVVDAWAAATGTPPLAGVYAQTTGPRFETPAEVRFLAAHADVVGMTLAAECVLAGEAGLAWAALCTVDNLANGVADTALDVGALYARVADQRSHLEEQLTAVLGLLADRTVDEEDAWP